jgi:quercetin dioxygenase-like cupin family protein
MQYEKSDNVKALREIVPHLDGSSPCGMKATWKLPEGTSEAWAIWADADDVSVTKARVSAGSRFPIHVHDEVEVLIVYRGRLRYVSATRERVLLPGACIRIEPGRAHEVEAVGHSDAYVLAIHVPAGKGLPENERR